MRKPIILGLSVLLAGCAGGTGSRVDLVPSMEAAAEKAVKDRLAVPVSALFRNTVALRQDSSTVAVCGHVRFKKTSGKYAQFTPFYARLKRLEYEDGKALYAPVDAVIADSDRPGARDFYSNAKLCDPANWR